MDVDVSVRVSAWCVSIFLVFFSFCSKQAHHIEDLQLFANAAIRRILLNSAITTIREKKSTTFEPFIPVLCFSFICLWNMCKNLVKMQNKWQRNKLPRRWKNTDDGIWNANSRLFIVDISSFFFVFFRCFNDHNTVWKIQLAMESNYCWSH